MDQPLRMILIGAGAMGRAWLETIHADPRWELAALADTHPATLAEAAAQYAIPADRCFGDARAALEDVQADGVMVVTPPETHRMIATDALERGLPVFSEKPLAASLSDGVKLLNVARTRRTVLMVGQGRRWLPHIIALRDAVRSGVIGSLGYVTCQFRIPIRFGGWRNTMPEVLIEDMAIHHFDSIRYITCRNGRQLTAHSFRPDWSWFAGNSCASVDLVLDGNIPVHYFGSWVARGPRSAWDGELILVGSEGALTLREDETVWLYRGEDETPTQIELPRMSLTGMAYGLDLFTQAVRGQAAAEPDAEDNIFSLALTSAAVASSRIGRAVDVDAHMRAAGWNPLMRH